MMDALGVAVNRLFNYIENLCRYIFKKQNNNIYVEHSGWSRTYMPPWVKKESYKFIKRRKHRKYKKMYLRGKYCEYKVFYNKNGSVNRCMKKLRVKNN